MTSERSLRHAVFLPGIDPSGRLIRPVAGRLSCPHCDELHRNPEDGFYNTWTRVQIKALAAMKASRVCSRCGKPSIVVDEERSEP